MWNVFRFIDTCHTGWSHDCMWLLSFLEGVCFLIFFNIRLQLWLVLLSWSEKVPEKFSDPVRFLTSVRSRQSIKWCHTLTEMQSTSHTIAPHLHMSSDPHCSSSSDMLCGTTLQNRNLQLGADADTFESVGMGGEGCIFQADGFHQRFWVVVRTQSLWTLNLISKWSNLAPPHNAHTHKHTHTDTHFTQQSVLC